MNSRQGEPLIILASSVEYCFATWDRVLIIAWRGEIATIAAQELIRVARRFVVEGNGQKLGCLTVISSDCPSPSEQARVQLAKTFSELDVAAVEHYLVAEGSPSQVALFRGVVLALSSSALAPLQLRFAVSVQEAAQMLAPILSSTSGRAPVFRSIVEQVRSHMSEHGSS